MFNFKGEKKPAKEEDINDGMFSDKEKPPMTFAKLLEDLKNGHYNLEQVKNLPVLVNGKPLDRISFGGNGGVNFVGGEFSEKLPSGAEKSEDIFDAPLDKSGFPKKPLMTFSKLLEDLKDGSYNLEQVKDLPVLVNGKPIDCISFDGNGGVDFASKE